LYYHYLTKKDKACSTSWLEKKQLEIWYEEITSLSPYEKFANKSASNTEEWDKVDQHYGPGETGN